MFTAKHKSMPRDDGIKRTYGRGFWKSWLVLSYKYNLIERADLKIEHICYLGRYFGNCS